MCKTNTIVCEQPVGRLRAGCTFRAMDSVLAWMALLARSGKGARWVRREVSRAGSPVAAWQDWAQSHPSKAAATWDRAQRQHQSIQRLGAHVVTFHDPRYPALLAHIPDAPPVLYARGTWPKPEGWGRALAVVGTRGCSPQGAAWALQAGREWTEAGGRLVSGLARGIDGRAHQGALNGARGGAQAAVLPCALDAIHPRMHEELAEAIVARGGLLLTEQPPGVQVERWMFASRNRILTGLAPTTVVIQSPARGGSLISARCAFDQDREVFALWQKGMGASWSGNRALVADELAVPVADVNALWRAIAEGAQSRQTGSAQGGLVAFPEGCREVWDALDNARPTTWDQLRKTCEGRTVDLERQLFTLEMLGWTRRLPGRAFLRN